jgi:hypothetical protein
VSDIDSDKANELFDIIDKFAGYGFNKSHAAAYALLAYQTAWFKAHYPTNFTPPPMCFDMHQSEKLAVFVDDMRRNGIAVAGPCLNHSEAEFMVEQTADGHQVRYALAGIRNVGEKAMEVVVAERRPMVRSRIWKTCSPACPMARSTAACSKVWRPAGRLTRSSQPGQGAGQCRHAAGRGRRGRAHPHQRPARIVRRR